MHIGEHQREIVVEPLQMPEPLRPELPSEPDLSPDYLPATPEPVEAPAIHEPVGVPA